VCLPPFFSGDPAESVEQVPSFLRACPTAIINYRWPRADADGGLLPPESPPDSGEGGPYSALGPWPTPLHDVLFGYDWITQNLSPADPSTRRDILVYGSYLGAGLAAALALTETRPDARMAVRALVAFNGIYNWTTFLPDHPLNRRARDAPLSDLVLPDGGGPAFAALRRRIPALFTAPSDLFDPFASPSLFFHTTGMTPPDDFAASALPSSLASAIDALSLGAAPGPDGAPPPPPDPAPRKGYLAFPPRHSELQIPEALLLHETAPPPSPLARPRRRGRVATTPKRRKAGENSFAAQAAELAALMRRSVAKLEARHRIPAGDEGDGWEAEAESRARAEDVGAGGAGHALGSRGEEAAREWLAERMDI